MVTRSAAARAAPAQPPPSAGGGTVFVTVGTTKFDALIAAVDDLAVAGALVARGYRKLVMQVPFIIVMKGGKILHL